MTDGPSVSFEGAGAHLAPPTDEEAAAIVAAIEAVWPRAGLAADDPRALTPRWRFSGRWWSKPIPARRDRPF
ncbi:MAG TPA: hypothetical protein PKA98_01855 [Acidimicrobiales bacterium]|nr:hypothetical protein [Acidimicrobiales bacterium]